MTKLVEACRQIGPASREAKLQSVPPAGCIPRELARTLRACPIGRDGDLEFRWLLSLM
jgi:hypothetical protein